MEARYGLAHTWATITLDVLKTKNFSGFKNSREIDNRPWDITYRVLDDH